MLLLRCFLAAFNIYLHTFVIISYNNCSNLPPRWMNNSEFKFIFTCYTSFLLVDWQVSFMATNSTIFTSIFRFCRKQAWFFRNHSWRFSKIKETLINIKTMIIIFYKGTCWTVTNWCDLCDRWWQVSAACKVFLRWLSIALKPQLDRNGHDSFMTKWSFSSAAGHDRVLSLMTRLSPVTW